MDRRSLIKNAGIAGVLAAGVAPAVVNAQAAVRWRLSSSFPKALDTIYGAAEVFASKVKAMSGGKFEISTHAGGEITPPFGVVDAVQQGSIEMAHTAPYYFFGKNEAFALGCAIPFGMNSRQMTAWMYEGNGLKLMREFYAKYNMTSFPDGNTGAQMGGWYRKEIKTLADIKGVKMRIGGFAGKVFERMGGVPEEFVILMPDTALEKGIDAMTRLQRALTRRYFLAGAEKILITFSAGVAQLVASESGEDAITRADQAMYLAKRAGKNRVLGA